MPSSESRLPSLWIVLIPALLLAALGARAVVTEAERAETEARQRGRAAAGRLARSMETLLAEFEEALPGGDTPRDADELLEGAAFLSPVWLLGAAGERLDAAGDAPVPAEDAELLRDALEQARRLEAGEDRGVAAPLLAGAAEVVRSDAARTALLLRAAELGITSGRYREAARDLEGALAAAARTPPDGWADRALAVVLGLIDGDPAMVVDAEWPLGVAEAVASGRWRVAARERETALGELERVCRPAITARIGELRRIWNERRAAAGAESAPRASVESSEGLVVVTLHRRVLVRTDGGEIRATLGGRVPAVTVQERLADEARALVAEGGIVGVHLLSPDGVEVLRETGTGAEDAADTLIESAPLGSPLIGFSVVAGALPERGPGALAWLLAVAGVLTTTALLWGAFALNRAALRQARLAEDRQRFLDHVAHEIRTPATALLTLSEELASGHVRAEREPLYREHLLTEARRLADLVDDTLDLTRLEAGKLAFHREHQDLRAVLADAVAASAARRGGREGPAVELAPGADTLTVDADRAALARVFRNLIDNAVFHGGGDRPVTVVATADGPRARVTVRDHGRGIAAEHLPRLFERFYRVPEATHETKGVGLGLSLCHEVITRHGGTIDVHSRAGEGTEFTITLPREGPHGS